MDSFAWASFWMEERGVPLGWGAGFWGGGAAFVTESGGRGEWRALVGVPLMATLMGGCRPLWDVRTRLLESAGCRGRWL